MSARDAMLPVRRAVLATLKSDSDLTALVPAARIYPQSPPAQPTWPFIRYGAPSNVPRRGACLDGCDVSVAVHGFSKGIDAEDNAARIGAAIARALEGKKVDLAPGRGSIIWRGSQLLQDGDEAGAYHVVVNFLIRALV